MQYSIQHHVFENTMEVTLRGNHTIQQIKAVIDETLEISRRMVCKKFLVDASESPIFGECINLYEFASQLPQMGFLRNDTIAIVFTQEFEDHTFFETVAYNRGWINIRNFASVDCAQQWLQGR